jgi:hypothetical protein
LERAFYADRTQPAKLIEHNATNSLLLCYKLFTVRSTRWDNSLVVNRQGIVKTEMLPISQPTRNRRHAIQSRYILMPVSMLVKCEKCGYENFPQHRYCGMCAAELHLPGPGGSPPKPAPVRVSVPSVPTPPVVSRPVSATPAPRREEKVEESAQLSGPSFLGLGNEPAENRSVSYLLEDDEPRHRGRNFILILLLAAAAFAAWHWRQDLRVIAGRFLSSPPPVGSTSTPDSNSTAAASTSATPQADASANNQVQQPAQAPAASPSDQTPAAPVPAGSGAADSSQSPPASQPPADQAQPSDQSQAATSTAAKPDDSADAPASQPAPERKAAKVQAQSKVADLEAEGEKYLYGNGVRENCTRARTSLLAAAQQSSAQAANVLGTMYATGHCATRDLPTAYRWFSRSLRKDPSNTRIEQDLKVLWNQMTPGEKQLALRDVH